MTGSEIASKLAAVALSCLLLLNAAVFRRVSKSWMAPGCLLSLFWFGYTFIPLVMVFPVPVDPLAVVYILASVVAFCAGSFFIDWDVAISRNRLKCAHAYNFYDNPVIKVSFWMSVSLSLVFFIINSYIQKISLQQLIGSFFDSAGQYVTRRYSGELAENMFGRFANVFSYIGAATGGFLYAFARSGLRRRSILFVAMLPSIFVMVTQSARGMLFLALSFFIAAFACARVAAGHIDPIRPRTVMKNMAYLVALIPLIAISLMSKGLYESQDYTYIWDRLVHGFASYTCGHIYAFSDWFSYFTGRPSSNVYAPSDAPTGFYTFTAVFKALGSTREVAPGVYEEYFTFSNILTTNIYTMFRGLILDFGIVGSLILSFATGVMLHVIYFMNLCSPRPAVTTALYILMTGCFYTSFIVSLLIWNSVYVTFGLLCVVLLANKVVRKGRVAARMPAAPVRIMRPSS